MVDPHDGPQPLNPRSLLVLYEISMKQAFALCLHIIIVTLRRTCCRSTSCAYRAGSDARNVVAAGTFELIKVHSCSETLIELVVQLVSRTFHSVEDVKTPINCVEIICMLIGANITHASFTTSAVFECLYVRVFVFIMYTTGWYIASLWSLDWYLNFARWLLYRLFAWPKKELSNFLH